MAHDIKGPCWQTGSVEVQSSHQYPVKFSCHVKVAAVGQPNKMMSDMEVRMKQSYVTEFLLMLKNGTH